MWNNHGYIEIRLPNHHSADGRGYVRQHRLVYEEFHKCSLLSWTVVHHINGIKNDNRIENLKAFMNNQTHIKTEHGNHRDRRRCSICGKLTLMKEFKGYLHYYWYKNLLNPSEWVCNPCHCKQRRTALKSVNFGRKT